MSAKGETRPGEDRLMISISGVRGIVGEALTEKVGEDFAGAFATMLASAERIDPARRRPLIALGRDTRPSGPALRDAIVRGLTAGGVDVADLGVVSTPGVALMIKRLRADGGIVITASHNPPPYNGIKFMSPQGVNLPADAARRLKEIWEGARGPQTRGVPLPTYVRTRPDQPGTVTLNDQTHDLHVRAVLEVLDVPAIAAGKFKVVLDCINGAGCLGTPRLLERLSCRASILNGQPTGQFAHEPEPIEKNLSHLGRVVRERKADVGFAQDPDADRLVVVDETGRFIGEEYTLALATAFVLGVPKRDESRLGAPRGRKGDVATNLSTTRMMDDVAAAAGVKLWRTAVGEAHVAECMLRHGCVFGGEGNGGVMDPRVVLVRDSFVGIGLLLNFLAETGKTVSQLVSALPRYEMIKDKFPCPLDAAPRILAHVRDTFAGRGGAKINDQDGLRIDLPEGWTHVRPSNTEPIMRIITEAARLEDARAIAAQVRAVADDILGES